MKSYQVLKYHFQEGYIEGNYIWTVSTNHPKLLCINMSNMNLVCDVNLETIGPYTWYYLCVAMEKEKVIIFPCNGKEVIIYDLNSKKQTSVSFFKNEPHIRYVCKIFDRWWMFSINIGEIMIATFDLERKEIKEEVKWENTVLEVVKGRDEYRIKYLYDGSNLLMFMVGDFKVYKMNLLKETLEPFFELSEKFSIDIIEYADKHYWITLSGTPDVVCFSFDDGIEYIGINFYKDGFEGYRKIVVTEENIILATKKSEIVVYCRKERNISFYYQSDNIVEQMFLSKNKLILPPEYDTFMKIIDLTDFSLETKELITYDSRDNDWWKKRCSERQLITETDLNLESYLEIIESKPGNTGTENKIGTDIYNAIINI